MQATQAGICDPTVIFRLVNLTFECRYISGHFQVIYNRSGIGEAGPDTDGDGVPQRVEMVMEALEDARAAYMEMGFKVPELPVPVVLAPTLGGGISLPGSLSRLIILSNTVDTEFLPQHEFFHQVQWQYINELDWLLGRSETRWWMEATANWAVHQIFELGGHRTDEDEYSFDVPVFLRQSNESIADTDTLIGGPEYGAFVFPQFLSERFGGTEAVRDVWERVGDGITFTSPLRAVADMVRASGGDFKETLAEFRQSTYTLASSFGVGFDDSHADTLWRSLLAESEDATLHGDDFGGARPPRTTVNLDLDSSNPETGSVDLKPTGAKFVDITTSDQSAAAVDIMIDAGPDVIATVLPFEEYPSLCDIPQRIDLQDGEGSLTIELGLGCSGATLVLTNTDSGAVLAGRHAAWSMKGTRLGRVITNGTVALGVRREGQLILGDYGLRHLASDDDGLAHGCECEGWGAADELSSVSGGANESEGGADNVRVVRFDTTPSTAESEVVVGEQSR